MISAFQLQWDVTLGIYGKGKCLYSLHLIHRLNVPHCNYNTSGHVICLLFEHNYVHK